MSLLSSNNNSSTLSYEDYMAEPEIMARYDILHGMRQFTPPATDEQRDIALSAAMLLREYELRAHLGTVWISPRDVLITRNPLRTRQPDVMFISNERSAGRKRRDVSPYSPAPELVVEILSPGETRAIRAGKLRDYCSVDVKECWVVNIEMETIEVFRLSSDDIESAAVYRAGQSVESLTFPGLVVSVNDIFEIE